jgi:hypothetical protein
MMSQLMTNDYLSSTKLDISNSLLNYFNSNEGYRQLTSTINDEYKLLQDTKKILDKRISLDEQYARNLQELTANADRIAWPTTNQPLASVKRKTNNLNIVMSLSNSYVDRLLLFQVCREVFLQWSDIARQLAADAQEFRCQAMTNILKPLLEQRLESRKFLDDERIRYDRERQKVRPFGKGQHSIVVDRMFTCVL